MTVTRSAARAASTNPFPIPSTASIAPVAPPHHYDAPSPSSPPSPPTPPRAERYSALTPRAKRYSALTILLLSVAFHLAYLPALFDIYFTSPVAPPISQRFSAPHGLAKRVVLFVGDGARADKVLQTYSDPPFEEKEMRRAIGRKCEVDSMPHAPVSDVDGAFVSSYGGEEEKGGRRTTPAPFLRGLIQKGEAQWGISHTRVPTESRPGHVALIGGMYEDVSAVTKGWTTNPVPFDSVFNQSTHAFTFGSPDILPMFKLGASPPEKVSTWSYSHEYEDFTSDAVHLDLWVLDQLEALLKNASADPGGELDKTLRQDGVAFFEHLLGLDTTGHSYRPHGAEYHRNIRVLDLVIRRTVTLLSHFYNNDGETAFVFTADHGMSSLGNHGDGHPDNTRTPLVVWGKGARGKGDWEEPDGQDEYSVGWGLRGVRRDVEQADVAPLMSVLAGIPYPANSAGRVPLEYLDASPAFRAQAAFANAKQLLAEAEAKSDAKKATAISFRPFPELVDSPTAGTLSPAFHRKSIEELLEQGDFVEAENRSIELGEIALRASAYFQKYDWFLLQSIVTAGYTGFMAFVTHSILLSQQPSSPSPAKPSRLSLLRLPVLLVSALITVRFLLEGAPYTYFLYVLFPTFFWFKVFSDPSPFTSLFSSSAACSSSSSPSSSPTRAKLALTVLSILIFLLLLAYGYTSRSSFAFIAFSMGLGWPSNATLAVAESGKGKEQDKKLGKVIWVWIVSMAALSVFPCLPVEKGEDLRVVSAGAVALVGLAVGALKLLGKDGSPTWKRTRRFLLAEIVLTVVCLGLTCSSALSLQRKQGLPVLNKYAGWLVLLSSSLLPILHGRPRAQPTLERLSVLLLAFSPAFILLSLSYEALFYADFCVALVAWSEMEGSLAAASRAAEEEKLEEGKLGLREVRIELFFLAFLHLGFFGVGNIASISSFYLEPVYRLMTVFAPFPMGALLLFKLLIPFVALAAVSSVINRHLRLPPLSLFLVGSVVSEILTIYFFFRVTDTGSWLEIGASITNSVISSMLGLFSTVLLVGGEYLLAGTV
ncbi:hypothetical protein JCM8547_002496 [Rhodosporidiobolus lusitaniae]